MWWRNYPHTLSKKQNRVFLWINSFKVLYSLFFIIYQLEDYWSIMKPSCRPLTLNSHKAFLKNKNRSGKTLSVIFYKIFEKKVLLYSITWRLTLNFHHLVKRIPLPAKFPISPMGRYPRVSHRCWEHGGRLGEEHGGEIAKCCWKISVKEFICW